MKINQAAQEKLLKYQWPGNIRELEHTIEKGVILCDKKEIEVEQNHEFLPGAVLPSDDKSDSSQRDNKRTS